MNFLNAKRKRNILFGMYKSKLKMWKNCGYFTRIIDIQYD